MQGCERVINTLRENRREQKNAARAIKMDWPCSVKQRLKKGPDFPLNNMKH